MNDYIISPTGRGIRSDSGGDGHYGTSRMRSDGTRYAHTGTDFAATPGMPVVAPAAGKVVRIARPYASDDRFSGLLVVGQWITYKLFYVEPLPGIVGKQVEQGEVVGVAQDIGMKYQGVTPHVHLEIVKISMNPERYWRKA